VLSTVPVMFSYWAAPEHGYDWSRFLNDHLAGVVQSHPRRFIGLGTIPLQAPELAVRELIRCVRDLGLAGVQIGTHVGPWNLDHPALFPVFEAAERLGAAVFVHPWDMLAPERMTKYWLRWLVGMPAETALAMCSVIFGGVLERLPRLRIGFAHGGGAFPGTFGRVAHGFEARPDLVAVDNPHPPAKYLRRIYVDSLTHDADALRLLLRLHGAERVALGSDYPFPLGESPPGRLIAAMPDLDHPTRARLLHGTALEFLARTGSDFE
jgi:aminocarboxymuconate-semialdehyde decarboxylase